MAEDQMGMSGQSEGDVKGMMSMQRSGMTIEEAEAKEEDVLSDIEAKEGKTYEGGKYTVKMDSDDKMWGKHTAVCASVSVSIDLVVYAFECVCKLRSCTSCAASLKHRQPH